MRRSLCSEAAIVVGALVGFGCTGLEPKQAADRATLPSESAAALDALKNADPSLQELMDKAVGYVGLQAGAQTGGKLFLFMRPQDLDAFKQNRFALAGNIQPSRSRPAQPERRTPARASSCSSARRAA